MTDLEKNAESLVTEGLRKTCPQCFPRPGVHISSRHDAAQRVNVPHIVAQPQVAAHNMLEQSDSLGFHELIHHVAEDGANGIEALVGMAYVSQTSFIQKNLLHNENRHGF